MNSSNDVRATLRVGSAIAVAGALALGGLAGCSQNASSQQVLNSSDATNASGTTVGAYKAPEFDWVDNASYEVKTPSSSEISQIYTFTLAGKTYTLPCKASEFVDAGWTSVRDQSVPASFCSKAAIGNGYALGGDLSKQIGLNVLNTSSTEAAWGDCIVVGILVDSNSNVDFSTAAGIAVGDSYQKVQQAYGATSYAIDEFGTMGFHFTEASDSSKEGNRWYGDQIDTLSATPDNASAYPNWSDESNVLTIRLENFGDIAASE